LGALEEISAPRVEGVPSQPPSTSREASSATTALGIAVRMESVGVRAGGHTILENIELDLPASSHVAIVGSSGAGKSSLVGLLLGWHRTASGRVLIDGVPLDTALLDQLRQCTVWVDPAVMLWNRALLENLLYGTDGSDAEAGGGPDLGAVIHDA